jgi:hypothetical protein
MALSRTRLNGLPETTLNGAAADTLPVTVPPTVKRLTEARDDSGRKPARERQHLPDGPGRAPELSSGLWPPPRSRANRANDILPSARPWVDGRRCHVAPRASGARRDRMPHHVAHRPRDVVSRRAVPRGPDVSRTSPRARVTPLDAGPTRCRDAPRREKTFVAQAALPR